jgi:hypothetical protein
MKTKLGRFDFPTKKAAFDEARRVLNTAPPNIPLVGYEGELLRALIPGHPDAADKLGGFGLDQVTIEVRSFDWLPGMPQRGMFIIRPDGSEIDFSYLVALGRKPRDRRTWFYEACRNAVAQRMHEHKTRYFAGRDVVQCEATGEWLCFADAEVDHAEPWPFVRIVQVFLTDAPMLAEPDVSDPDGLRRVFTNPRDAEAFIRFHDQRAVLRVVHRDINSRKRKVSITD